MPWNMVAVVSGEKRMNVRTLGGIRFGKYGDLIGLGREGC